MIHKTKLKIFHANIRIRYRQKSDLLLNSATESRHDRFQKLNHKSLEMPQRSNFSEHSIFFDPVIRVDSTRMNETTYRSRVHACDYNAMNNPDGVTLQIAQLKTIWQVQPRKKSRGIYSGASQDYSRS